MTWRGRATTSVLLAMLARMGSSPAPGRKTEATDPTHSPAAPHLGSSLPRVGTGRVDELLGGIIQRAAAPSRRLVDV